MGYLTFFQLLRRCLLMDAAEHPPPRSTWKHKVTLAMEKKSDGGRREPPGESHRDSNGMN